VGEKNSKKKGGGWGSEKGPNFSGDHPQVVFWGSQGFGFPRGGGGGGKGQKLKSGGVLLLKTK